jgi:hypothetical protein
MRSEDGEMREPVDLQQALYPRVYRRSIFRVSKEGRVEAKRSA